MLNNVTIFEKSFRIETPDVGVIEVPTNRVKTIVYKNAPSYQTDMLRTINSSEFNGVVLNDPVAMASDDLGGTVSLAKGKILSIIW